MFCDQQSHADIIPPPRIVLDRKLLVKKRPASVHLLWFPAYLFLLMLHFDQLRVWFIMFSFLCVRGYLCPLQLLWHSPSMWQQLGGLPQWLTCSNNCHDILRFSYSFKPLHAFLWRKERGRGWRGEREREKQIYFSWISDIPKWEVKNKQGFLVHAVI